MRPQTVFPQTFGRAVRILYTRLDLMDFECARRFADQFAFHLNNHGFYWPWQYWNSALSLPEDSPKRTWINSVLVKLLSFSYHQRINDVLPEQFRTIIPQSAPHPQFKWIKNAELPLEFDGIIYIAIYLIFF